MSNDYDVPKSEIRCTGKCPKCATKHCGDDIAFEYQDVVTGQRGSVWKNPEYVWWRVWTKKNAAREPQLVQMRMLL